MRPLYVENPIVRSGALLRPWPVCPGLLAFFVFLRLHAPMSEREPLEVDNFDLANVYDVYFAAGQTGEHTVLTGVRLKKLRTWNLYDEDEDEGEPESAFLELDQDGHSLFVDASTVDFIVPAGTEIRSHRVKL